MFHVILIFISSFAFYVGLVRLDHVLRFSLCMNRRVIDHLRASMFSSISFVDVKVFVACTDERCGVRTWASCGRSFQLMCPDIKTTHGYPRRTRTQQCKIRWCSGVDLQQSCEAFHVQAMNGNRHGSSAVDDVNRSLEALVTNAEALGKVSLSQINHPLRCSTRRHG